jgi:hypothetical protein
MLSMLTKPITPEMKRYTVRVILLMASYVAALIGANLFLQNNPAPRLSAYAVALLPALPIIGVFVTIGRLLHELRDEYVRMLLVRQALVATGFALSVATAWGFLEDFGFLPHVPGYWAAIIWFSGLGVGGCVNWIIESKAA